MGAKEEINTAAATAAEVSSSALLADANSDDDCTAAPTTTPTTTATHIVAVASTLPPSSAAPPAATATTMAEESSPCNDANDNPTPVPQQSQQQQHQKEGEKEPQQVPEAKPAQPAYLPQASPPPQVIIIPATQASTLATNAAKKIRRAFSMPRNPFRWSRKFKTSAAASASGTLDGDSVGGGRHNAMTACVGGGGRGRTGSIVSLSSYEAVSKDTNGAAPTATVGEAEVKKPAKKVANGRVATAGGDNNAHITPGSGNGNRVFRRSSIRKFLNRIAQHVSSSVNGAGATGKHGSPHTAYGPASSGAVDRVPPIGGYQWPADQTPGVMGLKNHGNTCFMNAVLQCLSHTDILAEYFVLDQYKADLKRRNKINSRKFGTKGELTEQLANVLKALWTCKNETDHGTSFKAVVDRYGSQFRSSTQHDAQEFLFWLLDKVHEDLNTATKRRYKSVKNNYGRSDEIIAAETLANHIRCNNSFVQAVFQAQFRSSLTCPRCKKQSNTFDPFHCISVQLPQLTQQTIFVTVVYMKPRQPRQVRMGVVVPAGSPIVALREQLQKDTNIPSHRMVLVDLNKEGFSRVFYDSQPVETLKGIDSIYCLEVEEVKPKQAEKTAAEASNAEASKASAESGKREASKTSTPPSPSKLLVLVACARKSLKKEENKSEEDSKEEIEKGPTASKDEKVEKNDKVEKEEKVVKDDKVEKDVKVAKDAKNDDAGPKEELERFGVPFSLEVPRDCSYSDLQKRLLRELAETLKPETFSYSKPLKDMFQIRLQDPSADPDAYLEQVEHPLLTEMIDLALSVLSSDAGPAHIKLLLEWADPEAYFSDLTDEVVEDESVSRLMAQKASDSATLTLEQCLEHYTKAETLSAEDAWRCPHCQQYLPVVKTLGLWSLPDILVVHFKRFRQHHDKGGNAAKLTTMVKFPLNAFDMSPHLARGEEGDIKASLAAAVDSVAAYQLYRPGASWKKGSSGNSRSSTLNSRDNRETRYDLYAVCYHQGDTLETGHYTAACKNPYDRQWYKFDDQRVSKVPADAIEEEIINNEAYMLFYQRRMGGEGSECSASSSNSGDHWVSRIPPPVISGTLKVDKEKKAAESLAKEVSTVEEEKVSEPKQAETKPIEIPKEAETLKDSEETLAPKVVTKEADPLDAEGIVFADESPLDEERPAEDPDELEVLEELAASGSEVVELDDQHIFHMDEDVELSLNEKPADSKDEGDSKKAKTPPPVSPKKVDRVAASVAPSPSFTSPAKEKASSAPVDIKSSPSKASSLSSAASSSPESSGSGSPESYQATPQDTASRLPSSRLNGYSAPHGSGVRCRKDTASPMLSSSLKSTSSSIIGAAAMHDYKLARQQQYHWNGSRSSVSAVENAVGAAGGHHGGPCLSLRHSFSMSSNTCSKDTLIFIDQQSHHRHHHHHSLIEDEDDDASFMDSRSLWISPVTPHKLITVSPKN